jgi:hypothetical protein
MNSLIGWQKTGVNIHSNREPLEDITVELFIVLNAHEKIPTLIEIVRQFDTGFA